VIFRKFWRSLIWGQLFGAGLVGKLMVPDWLSWNILRIRNFRPAQETHQNRTFKLHVQPLPHFINSTNCITQRFNFSFTILITLIFYNFSKRNIKAPWRWCRSTETCRCVCNLTLYIYIYICVCVCVCVCVTSAYLANITCVWSWRLREIIPAITCMKEGLCTFIIT